MEYQTVTIVVPEGSVAGQVLTIAVGDSHVQIQVPEGAAPGTNLSFQVPIQAAEPSTLPSTPPKPSSRYWRDEGFDSSTDDDPAAADTEGPPRVHFLHVGTLHADLSVNHSPPSRARRASRASREA